MNARARLSLMLCAALLAACGRKPVVREQEPNDAAGQATVLPGECTVTGSLSSPQDVDFYRLDVTEPHNASLHLSGVPHADLVLSVLDRDRREVKRYDENGVDGQEDAVDLGLDPGTYYFRVSDKLQERVASLKPYTLEVGFEPAAGREREPDDSREQATVVSADAMGGHYFPSRNALAPDSEHAEADWFRLAVPADGRGVLDAEVSGVPGVTPLLSVHDGGGRRLREAAGAGAGEGAALRGVGLAGPGSAFLSLRAQGLPGNLADSYSLKTAWRRWPGDTELEPNESAAAATPFAGETISGAIAPFMPAS